MEEPEFTVLCQGDALHITETATGQRTVVPVRLALLGGDLYVAVRSLLSFIQVHAESSWDPSEFPTISHARELLARL